MKMINDIDKGILLWQSISMNEREREREREICGYLGRIGGFGF